MRTVYVAPLGEVREAVVEMIALALWNTFGLPVECSAPLPDPAGAWDATRRQCSSPHVLREMQRHCPKDALRLVGITERDLFIPMLSFVYGQAQVGGRLALVSCARLHQEFYGLPANPVLFHSRVVKEGIHEAGHTFGLVHCTDRTCPMALSNTILQVDRKHDTLCASCTAMVQETIKKEML